MNVDRRAERARGLEQILQYQGYDIIPVIKYGVVNMARGYNVDWWGADLPLPESEHCQYVFLGYMQPILEDPISHRESEWARAGRYLVYDPSMIDVGIAIPDKDVEGEGELFFPNESGLAERGSLIVLRDRLMAKRRTLIDTSNSDGRIVAISKKPIQSAAPQASPVAIA